MSYLCKFEPGQEILIKGKIESINVRNDGKGASVSYTISASNDYITIKDKDIISLDNCNFVTVLPDEIIAEEYNRRMISHHPVSIRQLK